jgi:hypothetical protein
VPLQGHTITKTITIIRIELHQHCAFVHSNSGNSLERINVMSLLCILVYNLVNYEAARHSRLDPSGRGKGECELLEIPLSHLDIGRDLYPDPDYDYYERDRNAASANCKRQGYGGYGYDGYNRRNDQRPYYDNRWYDDRNSYGNRRPRPDFGYDDYDSYRPPPPGGNRRGGKYYSASNNIIWDVLCLRFV